MIAKHLILFYVLCVYPKIEAIHPNNTYDSNYGVDCVRIVEMDEKSGARIEIRSPT